jgi:hypothetical protein
MMTPGTPEAICQSRKRFRAASSIERPSGVKGVTVTLWLPRNVVMGVGSV